MTVTITFTRTPPTARHAMPADIGDFHGHSNDPYFDVCRNMLDASHPDSPAVFVDERGVACLTVKSLHACARRYRPNVADTAAKQERAKGKKQK